MKSIDFKELPISSYYGNKINRIFYVLIDGKSKMIKSFMQLDDDYKDDIKDIISKMATQKGYKSSKIKWNLHGYNYGEIRPFPHRFFFF